MAAGEAETLRGGDRRCYRARDGVVGGSGRRNGRRCRLLMFRRLVRLHLKENQPSVEGILMWSPGAHYRVRKASLLEAEHRSHSLDGEAWVPKSNVLLVQRLK